MSEFKPQFPRTVAGTDWRVPLDRPELEATAKRLDHLYRNCGLSETHRAEIIARYALLADADKAIEAMIASIAKFASDSEISALLVDPGIRPKRPRGGGSVGSDISATVGFTLRLAEWVQRLEDVYGLTAYRKLGEIVPRNEYGDPIDDYI